MAKWVAFKGKSLLSKTIRFWTRSQYSHIAYLMDDNTLIECWHDPGKAMNEMRVKWDYVTPPFIHHKEGTPYEIWELNISHYFMHWDNEVQDFMTKLADSKAKYDFGAVFGFIFKWRGHKKRGWMCSEGCIEPLVKLFEWDRIVPSQVSPQDFVEIIQAAGAKRIYEGKI